MDDVSVMRRGQPSGEPQSYLQGPLVGHRARNLIQSITANEFRGDVGMAIDLPNPINPHDVRMLQSRGGAGLHQEALADYRVRSSGIDEFDRHQTLELRVVGLVDPAHRPFSDAGNESIVVEFDRWFPFVARNFPDARQSAVRRPG